MLLNSGSLFECAVHFTATRIDYRSVLNFSCVFPP
jgi:hypothetical protein